jgi:hypothetical protein
MKQKEKAMKNQEILFTSPGIAELQEYSVPVPQARSRGRENICARI